MPRAEADRVGEMRRRMRRARNDARAASHRAWMLRVGALESQLRTQDLAEQNRAIVARLGGLR